MKSFSEQLLKARTASGMTQEQLAQAVHVSRAAISHWETGRYLPDFQTIQALSQVLNYRFEWNDTAGSSASPAVPAGSDASGLSSSDSTEASADRPSSNSDPSSRKIVLILAGLCVLAALFFLLVLPALKKQSPQKDSPVSSSIPSDNAAPSDSADMSQKDVSDHPGNSTGILAQSSETSISGNVSAESDGSSIAINAETHDRVPFIHIAVHGDVKAVNSNQDSNGPGVEIKGIKASGTGEINVTVDGGLSAGEKYPSDESEANVTAISIEESNQKSPNLTARIGKDVSSSGDGLMLAVNADSDISIGGNLHAGIDGIIVSLEDHGTAVVTVDGDVIGERIGLIVNSLADLMDGTAAADILITGLLAGGERSVLLSDKVDDMGKITLTVWQAEVKDDGKVFDAWVDQRGNEENPPSEEEMNRAGANRIAFEESIRYLIKTDASSPIEVFHATETPLDSVVRNGETYFFARAEDIICIRAREGYTLTDATWDINRSMHMEKNQDGSFFVPVRREGGRFVGGIYLSATAEPQS